ncbi:hypothetical protein ACIBF7_34515 [Nonomuraea sp. NPDC050478]|uniref:hypothetical protein n=1 Tax=Nonomuraea sp. NPDC050478 TaxID=3364365 RepID=UPI00378C7A1B
MLVLSAVPPWPGGGSRPAASTRQRVDDERGDGHDAQDERPAQLGQAASSPKRQPLPARV